jgi:hypothetical protein
VPLLLLLALLLLSPDSLPLSEKYPVFAFLLGDFFALASFLAVGAFVAAAFGVAVFLTGAAFTSLAGFLALLLALILLAATAAVVLFLAGEERGADFRILTSESESPLLLPEPLPEEDEPLPLLPLL